MRQFVVKVCTFNIYTRVDVSKDNNGSSNNKSVCIHFLTFRLDAVTHSFYDIMHFLPSECFAVTTSCKACSTFSGTCQKGTSFALIQTRIGIVVLFSVLQ